MLESPFIVSEIEKYAALSLPDAILRPDEIRSCVDARLLLMLRRVDSADMALALVWMEDIVFCSDFLIVGLRLSDENGSARKEAGWSRRLHED